jgi:hypothetical protein
MCNWGRKSSGQKTEVYRSEDSHGEAAGGHNGRLVLFLGIY